MLLPLDVAGSLGHTARVVPVPHSGLSRKQLLQLVHGFYQVSSSG